MTVQQSIDFADVAFDEATVRAMRFAGGHRFLNSHVEMLVAPNFLDSNECEILVRLIDANRRRSEVADGVAVSRTSETCIFDAATPIIQLLDLRLSLFLGVAPELGEPIQGQRYGVGQEFKLHHDYFEPHHPEERTHTQRCGQRTWTAMIYLNEPEQGGETFFHYLDHAFKPETGTMLCWNNIGPGGLSNPHTLHAGQPVLEGTKYIVTKWFREKPWAR